MIGPCGRPSVPDYCRGLRVDEEGPSLTGGCWEDGGSPAALGAWRGSVPRSLGCLEDARGQSLGTVFFSS